MIQTAVITSDVAARHRFGTPAEADRYSRALVGTATHRREARCISRALRGVPRGAAVLDLPCGTGRMLPLLVGLGYRVTAADSSPHMVSRAAADARARFPRDGGPQFLVADAAQTAFPDDAFEAAVCNRLFHHFREPEVRRRYLRELARICTGPIVVSFFRRLALDTGLLHLKHRCRGHVPTDRIPIDLRTFREDARAAGLRVCSTLGKRPFVSTQWYAVLRRS